MCETRMGLGREIELQKIVKYPLVKIVQARSPAGQDQKLVTYVKKLIFFTFAFYHSLDIINIDFL